MIYITQDKRGNDVVNIHRGDDGALTIPLTDAATGEPYEMDPTETIIFTVRARPDPESCPVLLEAESEPGSDVIEFAHAVTEELDVGEYSADAQLMTRDGKRVTVWPKLQGRDRTSIENRKNFCILPEVCDR